METLTTKQMLLRTAEKLFAAHGIDAVSLRAISIAAKQRNNSAAQYHFGSKAGLIHALLSERTTEINAARQAKLDSLLKKGEPDLHQLIDVLFTPFIELLLDEYGGRSYVRFTAQLFSQGKGAALLSDPALIKPTQQQLFVLITRRLEHLPTPVRMQRLGWMAGFLVQAANTQDLALDAIPPIRRKQHIKRFSAQLIRFMVGGLAAPP